MRAHPLFGTAAAICLGGCTFSGQLHEMAVGYNEAVARATDSVMLLNVLRARDRQPMHFTSFTGFHGTLSADASSSLTANVGGESVTTARDSALVLTGRTIANGANTFVAGASGKLSTSPSFDLTVHDTQEFYRGILASVDAATVHHFLRQGWRADVVTYLFVEEIRVWDISAENTGGERKPLDRFENDPDDKVKAAKFALFVHCLALSPATRSTQDRPLFSLQELDKIPLGDLAILDGKKFDVASNSEGADAKQKTILRKGDSSPTLSLANQPNSKCSEEADKRKETGIKTELAAFHPEETDEEQSSFRDAAGTAFIRSKDREFELVLRSAQGVLYFLGEYIRANGDCPFKIIESNGTEVPLFAARSDDWRSACLTKSGGDDTAVVAVPYNGERHWIPREGAGRSLQVLALVEQLLNLQKSGDDRPTTQTVRVVQ